MPKFGKLALAVFVFGSFIGYGLLLSFLIRDPNERRKAAVNLVRKQTRFAGLVFGMHMSLTQPENFDKNKNYLIIGNHVSYLDALVVAYLAPVCFVTSVEMRDTPFLGLITRLAGCLYVERRSKDRINDEIKELTAALKNGFNVVVFPEATSTDGSALKPFKRPLLQAAIDADKPILPLTINYRRLDGQAVSSQNRDNLFWYGDMEFGGHFLRFLRTKRTEVEIIIHPAITMESEYTRDHLVEKSYAAVSSGYLPIV